MLLGTSENICQTWDGNETLELIYFKIQFTSDWPEADEVTRGWCFGAVCVRRVHALSDIVCWGQDFWCMETDPWETSTQLWYGEPQTTVSRGRFPIIPQSSERRPGFGQTFYLITRWLWKKIHPTDSPVCLLVPWQVFFCNLHFLPEGFIL